MRYSVGQGLWRVATRGTVSATVLPTSAAVTGPWQLTTAGGPWRASAAPTWPATAAAAAGSCPEYRRAGTVGDGEVVAIDVDAADGLAVGYRTATACHDRHVVAALNEPLGRLCDVPSGPARARIGIEVVGRDQEVHPFDGGSGGRAISITIIRICVGGERPVSFR